MTVPGQTGRRVLVVDDNDDTARTIALLLAGSGMEARVVNDGPAALAAADEWAPDVVLLDIGLAEMDGLEVARHLRARPNGAALRLVALTGLSHPTERQRGLDAGMDAYLVKPVGPDELLLAIAPSAALKDNSQPPPPGPGV